MTQQPGVDQNGQQQIDPMTGQPIQQMQQGMPQQTQQPQIM
jgi:hypothetical protein